MQKLLTPTCMVRLWAELDVAGVGLAFAHVMAVFVLSCVRMLDLMRVYTLFCGPRLLSLTPVPCEKAQASDVICKRVACL